MTGPNRRALCVSYLCCVVGGIFNGVLILIDTGAPDALANALELVWAITPFVLLAWVARRAQESTFDSWCVMLIAIGLTTFNCIAYYSAYCQRFSPGRTLPFGGHVFGFGLYMQWPAVALAAAVGVIRRLVVRNRSDF